MQKIRLLQLMFFLFFSSNCFAQWNTYFDLITERDSFPDIGEMSFINPRVGLATSVLPPILGNQNFRGGTLILTQDSGRTWNIQIVEDSIAFTDVKYLDSNLIIATGAEAFRDTTLAKQGAIARSLDGGLTWSINYFPMNLSNIAVLNDSTIMVAANDAKNPSQYSNFMISSNCGVSWTVLPSNYPGERITDLLFVNDSTGFASCIPGGILKTVNQGVSWDSLVIGNNQTFYIENLSSPDSINLFFNGDESQWQVVYRSPDLGITWTRIGQFQNVQFLAKAEFITDSIGFYVGSYIIKTYDQGASWIYTGVNGTSHTPFCTTIQFFDQDLIYLGGWNSFLRTSNGADSTILTGITENTKAAQPSLYPNPTKGIVNIRNAEGLERVEVYNLSGLRYYSAEAESLSLTNLGNNFNRASQYNVTNATLLDDQSKKYRDAFLVDLTNQPNGIYLLKLTMQNGEVFTKKVVKE